MTKQQDSKLAMYRTLRNLLQEHLEQINTIPALAEYVQILMTLIDDIEKSGEVQKTASAGKSAAKNVEKATLAGIALPALAAIHSLGADLNNEILMAGVKMTEYQLLAERDQELVRIVDAALKQLREHASELLKYGMTDELTATVRASRDSYYESLHGKDSGRAARKSSKKNLESLYQDGDKRVLPQLDRLMLVLSLREKALYREYQTARAVIPPTIRHQPPNEVPAEATQSASAQVPAQAPVQPTATAQ